MQLSTLEELFYIDKLSNLIILLVGVISIVILKFSKNYMQGDKNYSQHIFQVSLISFCVMIMAMANHLGLFVGALIASNVLLIRLMINNSQWKMAKASGGLAAKFFVFSWICMIASLLILYVTTKQYSIQAIINMPIEQNNLYYIAIYLMLIAAICQSAIWPFHKWLLSSLTSPTPVSALMHAGLINGGGFILIRFSPLFANNQNFLTSIFILGVGTSILGTFWKLMQNDYKRMLACSTMAQMGFMFMQCGLGLFAAAAAHLCWHGLFKAYLFLNAGSAAQQSRAVINQPIKKIEYLSAFICGLLGSYIFVKVSGKTWQLDTNLFLVGISFIASAQVAMTVLATSRKFKIIQASVVSAVCASLYALSILSIVSFLKPLKLDTPQPLEIVHIVGLLFVMSTWLALLFHKSWLDIKILRNIKKYIYVKALNASQPHASTITTLRSLYVS